MPGRHHLGSLKGGEEASCASVSTLSQTMSEDLDLWPL